MVSHDLELLHPLEITNNMIVAGMVAMTPTRLIGKFEGGLPWHIPEDLKLFKETTLGHSIVMGRKTYDTRGKALPGRKNIVLTRDHSWWVDDAIVINDPEKVVDVVDLYEKIFIIGGADIYSIYLPSIEELHVSTVYVDVEERPEDVYFPEFYDQFDYYKLVKKYDNFDYGIFYKDKKTRKPAPIGRPIDTKCNTVKSALPKMFPKYLSEKALLSVSP